MFLSFGENALEVDRWQNKSDMLDFMTRCDGGPLILGQNATQEVDFYSTIIHYNYAARTNKQRQDTTSSSWGIALISEGHGVKPHLGMLPGGKVVFGLNHEVVCISLDERREVFRLAFDSLFRAFLYVASREVLLVLNEIGVIAVTQSGCELWRFEKDIITDCLIDERGLRLEFMDSPPVRLDLSHGLVT